MSTAAKPRRHPSSDRFHAILKELGELHDKKQKDYGSEDDPFANIRATARLGIAPVMGVFIRMNDKNGRINAFARKGTLANESVTDSLRDTAVYSIIALVLIEEEGEGGNP